MKKVTFDVPDKRELGEAPDTFAAEAKALVVTDAASHARVLFIAKHCKENIGIITDKLAKVTKEAHEHHKSLCDLRTTECAPWQAIFNLADGKARQYTVEAERKAKAEQERIRVENLKAEEARRINEALLLEKSGATPAQVDKSLSAPVKIPAVTVAPEVAKVAGVAGRKSWKPDEDVTDLKRFVKFLATQPDDSPWWEVVELAGPVYNRLASAFKDKLAAAAPGLAAKEVTGNSYR